MKKRNIILFILAAALCVSLFGCLTGCGGNHTDDPKEPDNKGDNGNGTVTTPEEHPDFVWASEYIPVKGEFTNSFDNILYSNGRLLVSTYCMIRDNTPEGVIPEWEGQYWEWGEKLYWLNLDGTTEEISGYEPLPAPEDRDSSSYMQKMMLSPDGNIVTLECIYSSWYDGPEDIEMWSEEWWNAGYYEEYYHNEQQFFVRVLADDGSELSRFDLDALQEELGGEDYFYVSDMVMGPDGNFYFTCDQKLCVMDGTGTLLGTIEGENWFESLVVMPDGISVGYWGEEGEVLAPIDIATMTLGEGLPVRNTYNAIAAPAGSEYDFYYTDGSNLMGYDLETGNAGKVLNWINCDVDNAYSGRICVLPDGGILTLEEEWDNEYTKCSTQLVLLRQVPYDSVPHKTPITLATQYLNYDARSAIIKFNKNNPEYRIELKDYSEYNTEEDYSAGLTKLTAEIMAGNVPDIIDLNGMPYAQLVSKGLLADLYPLLDADSELSRDDLFPGVIAALEDDGHLYRTASGFALSTVVGAASIVGDEPGWTLAEFKDALAKMPEGCDPFDQYVTRYDIMNNMLNMELDNLIDWTTGKCYFDAPAFRDILEFSAQFPEIYEWPEDYIWTEEDDTPNRIATGRQMLLNTQLYDFDSYQMYNAMFGGDATFVGYPVSEGVGNALVLNGSGYAISAKCAHTDAAWEFLRTFFTEAYQTESVYEFPTNRAAFDKKLTEAMTPEYMKDENGNYILDENGNKIEINRGGWGWGGLQIELYALKQEEADEIVDLINSTTRILDYGSSESNSEVMGIIMQDTEGYFLGQKSLDEVVRLLQSKLNIFINEQR